MSEENIQDQQPVRPTDSNQKSTAGVKPKGGPAAAKRSNRTSGVNAGPQKSQAVVTVTRFAPIYVAEDAKPDFVCCMCRNGLDEVCGRCISSNVTDTSHCPIYRFKCGHMFHKHCLEIFRDLRECPYPGCNAKIEY